MDKNHHIQYWLNSAAHDLDVAETLFQNEKYDWCLFVGHLVVEKVLKAFYVRDTGESPPRIHNLLKLVEKTTLDGLVINPEKQFFVIPVKTGIQCFQVVTCFLDTRFRGYDDFLRMYQLLIYQKNKDNYLERLTALILKQDIQTIDMIFTNSVQENSLRSISRE